MEIIPKEYSGRMPKYRDPEILQQKIDEYFDMCDNTFIISYVNNQEKKTQKPYTISGLCVYLNICNDTLIEYEKNPNFVDILKNARMKILNYVVENASTGGLNPTFSIFNLKNNFHWKDKQEIEHSGDLKVTIEGTLEDFSD